MDRSLATLHGNCDKFVALHKKKAGEKRLTYAL
jgi:hypothetical protein